jgi:hypothetical protein
VWYPAELCSTGSDTPQDFVRRSIRPRRTLFCGGLILLGPRRTSVCYKIYTSLSLLCRVWYPARSCSMGSDTSQDFVLRGIRPHWQIKTPQNQRKKFKSLQFSLKGHFSKIVCMYKLHYPRLIVSMLKEPPILKMVFCSAGYDTPRNHFRIRNRNQEYFWCMNEGPIGGWGWFMKKTRGQKSHATVPLRARQKGYFACFAS